MIKSIMCIIFPLLILGHTWLVLSCINRTNVPQLDVKSHGNAVHKEYETVPYHVFFLKQEEWQFLNSFIWTILLKNLVLSFG